MNKEFIPYEQALELKELVFDEPCFGYWKLQNWLIQEKTRTDGYTHADQICSAPTFSQAFRWFREKYDLYSEILVDKTMEPKFTFKIHTYLPDFNWGESVLSEYLYRRDEEAELECLKKLIEIVKL